MNQEDMFDRIDAYLWDTLPAAERTDFEKEMVTDKELAAEVALRQMENQAMRLKAHDDLRAKMKAWKAEAASGEIIETVVNEPKIVPLSKNSRVVRFSPMRWAAAATVLLVVTLSTFYWGQTKYSDTALASQFFDVNSAILRGDTKGKNNFDIAADLMDQGKNSEAIVILQLLAKDTATFETAAFMLAEAYFKTQKYSEASAVYKEIMQRSQNNLSIQRAEFQELIMQLASGKPTNDFKKELYRIADDKNHAFQPQAIDLKNKIDSAWKVFF